MHALINCMMWTADPASSNITCFFWHTERYSFNCMYVILRAIAFSVIILLSSGFYSLADGSDLANIERNVSLYKGFGSRNKESVAELFVSLMSKVSCVKLFIYVYTHKHFDDLPFMFLVITAAHSLECCTMSDQKERNKKASCPPENA